MPPIVWLMHDFNCTKASDMKNQLKNGDMTESRVKEFFNFNDEQMKTVKEQVSILK